MGLNKKVSSTYVFFGCSIATKPFQGQQYGNDKGVHGSVISVGLNKNGTFTKVKAFLTSQVHHSEPMSGFDTGIYNLGSGPSVLPDGSLLIATGNGPFFPKKYNFGCSVLRVNGKTLKVKKGHFFSLNSPFFNECWYKNLEYSSSSVASVIKNKKLFSAIISKNGHLTVFNPNRFNKKYRTKVLIGENSSYGQPVLFINNNNQINVFSVSQTSLKTKFNQSFLVEEEQIKTLSHVTKQECFGYVAKKKKEKYESIIFNIFR